MHDLNSRLQIKGNFRTLHNCIYKLIRFNGECVLEPLPVFGLDFVRQTPLVCEDDVVGAWDQIDTNFTRSTRNLGGDIVAMSLGAGAVEVGNLAAVKFDDANGVV